MTPSTQDLKLRQPRAEAQGGFTLLELVIVMGMLVVVLTVTYKMLVDCLEADRTIDKLTVPEKIGEGILSLFRSDLSGTIYRGLGMRVFLVTDTGLPPDARDEIRFLSTVEPTPREEASSSTVTVSQERTITGVSYFLRPSQLDDNILAFTLFRKEMADLNPDNPLDSRGMNYEVYDKVKYLSFECFDGYTWVPDWNSEVRIQEEAQDLAQASQVNQQEIGRVSDPAKKIAFKTPPPSASAAKTSAPGVDPTSTPEAQVLPPAGIPVAVRIEIGVYVGSGIGGKVERDPQGSPVVKTYATIVPILAAQRVAIQLEDDLESGGSGFGNANGDGSGDGGGGGPNPSGGGGLSGASQRSAKAAAGGGGVGPGRAGSGRAAGPGGRPPLIQKSARR